MINCTHQIYPFIPGISSQTFESSEEIGEEEIERNYAERQEQRNIERNIRNNKHKAMSFENTGDTVAQQRSQENIYRWQQEMNRFIDKTGRVRNRPREQIVTRGAQPRGIKN